MRNLEMIIIHCSATPSNMDIGVEEIRKWHLERGFSDIGYHYVIRRDGELEVGRPINTPGAHCKGHNARSIGVCLVGGVDKYAGKLVASCNFTELQWNALDLLVTSLLGKYPSIQSVHGHNEFAAKDCPCFDVQEWVKRTRIMERRSAKS